MDTPSRFDLLKVTEIFLIPSSFIVAALGTADTNIHRAMVSLLGLIISAMWLYCSHEAISDLASNGTSSPDASLPRRVQVLSWLPWVFVVGWLVSTVSHAWYWNQPLG